MDQCTLSVALEVKHASAALLSRLIDELRERSGLADPSGAEPYADFVDRVPALHFFSLSVFTAQDHDPLFVLEANFDARPATSGCSWTLVSTTNFGVCCAAASERSMTMRASAACPRRSRVAIPSLGGSITITCQSRSHG